MRTASNEHGYTMLETIMYIGILVALGGTIANTVAKGFARYKVGRTIQQIVDVKKTVVQYTASWENYGDKDNNTTDKDQTEIGELCNQKLIEDKAIPLDITKSADGKNLYHALGGKIYIGSFANFGYTTADTDGSLQFNTCGDYENTYKYMFYVTFTDLKKPHCMEILTQGQFHGQGSEMDAIIVNIQDGDASTMRHFEHSFSKNITCNVTDDNKTKITPNTENATIKSTNFSVKDAFDACNDENDKNSITWIYS